MKRYIKSSTTQDRFSRRIVRNIAEEVIREHGENNSIGTYDSFIRTMMDRWGRPDGHDRDFIHDVITKAFEEEFSVKSSTSIKCSKVIDFAEHRVAKDDVSDSDWEQLQHTVNFDYYDSLQQMAQDLVNVIEDDQVWSEVEWNIFHEWYDEKGFTDDDWNYVEACGYERNQFDHNFIESSTSIKCSEDEYELSPELSAIIEDYARHKFKNPTTGWTGSCDAYLRELSDGAILVSLVFGGDESEPDEFTYNPETGKSVFYPYHGEIVHANSLDELRNAMRREYSYLKRVD